MTSSTAEKVKAKANGKPDKPKSPYGDAPTFSWQPGDGSEPIVFPKSAVLWEDVDGKTAYEFLWEIRKMTEAYQSFEFMDRAKVPDDIQRRVVRMPAAERRKFFDKWFADVNEPPKERVIPPES
jgi:hypothetical protein